MSGYLPAQPYIAPWQTQFNRYSVQILSLTGSAFDHRELSSGEMQWWRPLYVIARFQTSAAAGSRIMELQITPGNGQPKFLQPSALNLGPSSFATYIFGPGMTAYTQDAVKPFSVSVATTPDALWPPKTEFRLEANNGDAGDIWFSPSAIAVEMYTEDYNTGELVPAPPATPLLV